MNDIKRGQRKTKEAPMHYVTLRPTYIIECHDLAPSPPHMHDVINEWPLTVVNPLQKNLLVQAARTKGNRKMQRGGIVFIPLPAETFGGWHNGAVQQMKKLAGALARWTGQEEAEDAKHLFTRLSALLLAVQKNANIAS